MLRSFFKDTHVTNFKSWCGLLVLYGSALKHCTCHQSPAFFLDGDPSERDDRHHRVDQQPAAVESHLAEALQGEAGQEHCQK